MEQIDQGNKEFWKRKVDEARAFAGTDTEFCRQQGLNNTTFKNWKYRFSIGDGKRSGRSSRTKPSRAKWPFAAVQVKVPQMNVHLPDARWVAEVILHMQRGLM